MPKRVLSTQTFDADDRRCDISPFRGEDLAALAGLIGVDAAAR